MKAGLAVAEWLEKQPEVLRVLHPALPSCPGHEFYQRDFSGCPSLFSVVFQGFSDAACHAMIDSYKLFAIGASWGGFESLVLPATFFRTVAQPDHLTEGPAARYHVGLEDVADLIADLAQGLAVMRAFDDGGGQAAGAAAKSDRAMASSSGSGSGEVPPTIYHLASKAEWEAAVAAQRDYFTESLEKVGWRWHCVRGGLTRVGWGVGGWLILNSSPPLHTTPHNRRASRTPAATPSCW